MAEQPAGRGRRKKGASERITVTLPRSVLRGLEAWAENENIERTVLAAQAITDAVRAQQPPALEHTR